MQSSPNLRVTTSNGILVNLLCEDSPIAPTSKSSFRESSSPVRSSPLEVSPEQHSQEKIPTSSVDCPASSFTMASPGATPAIGRPRLSTSADTKSHENKTTSRPASPTQSSTDPLNSASKRKYQCTHPSCFKCFTTSGHLARHKRIHTKEKKFPCLLEECTSKFSRRDNMMQHYRTHAAGKSRRSGAGARNSVISQGNSYKVRQTKDIHPVLQKTIYRAKTQSDVRDLSNADSKTASPLSAISNTPNLSLHLPPLKNLSQLPYPRTAFQKHDLFSTQLPPTDFPTSYNISIHARRHTGPAILTIPPIRLSPNQNAQSSVDRKPTLYSSPQFHLKRSDVFSEPFEKRRKMSLQVLMTSEPEKFEKTHSKNMGTVDEQPQEDRTPSEKPKGPRQLVDLAHIVTAFG